MAVHVMLCLDWKLQHFAIHVIISKPLIVASVSLSQWLCSLRCRSEAAWLLRVAGLNAAEGVDVHFLCLLCR